VPCAPSGRRRHESPAARSRHRTSQRTPRSRVRHDRPARVAPPRLLTTAPLASPRERQLALCRRACSCSPVTRRASQPRPPPLAPCVLSSAAAAKERLFASAHAPRRKLPWPLQARLPPRCAEPRCRGKSSRGRRRGSSRAPPPPKDLAGASMGTRTRQGSLRLRPSSMKTRMGAACPSAARARTPRPRALAGRRAVSLRSPMCRAQWLAKIACACRPPQLARPRPLR
jgi:hypothetical protein